jgi:hypothetical protein
MPATVTHPTTWRPSPADHANLAIIADAMRREGIAAFPSRAAALRFALDAVAAFVRVEGHLPTAPTAD